MVKRNDLLGGRTFFIVKVNLEHYVALSHLKPCQHVTKK